MLTVESGWLVCPRCTRNKRVHKVPKSSSGTRIVVFCRDCKWEAEVDMHEGQCFESRSQ